MGRYVDLDEQVIYTCFDDMKEDWTQKEGTVEDVLSSVCDNYTELPEDRNVAYDRYLDLCEYFKNCSDAGKSILEDDKAFKAWLDRVHWHVLECDRLARELASKKEKDSQATWHTSWYPSHDTDG